MQNNDNFRNVASLPPIATSFQKGAPLTLHVFPVSSEEELTLVQIVPDWADPTHRRWLLSLRGRNRMETKRYESEQEARLRAFMATGVGDFLSGVTWVRIPRFSGQP